MKQTKVKFVVDAYKHGLRMELHSPVLKVESLIPSGYTSASKRFKIGGIKLFEHGGNEVAMCNAFISFVGNTLCIVDFCTDCMFRYSNYRILVENNRMLKNLFPDSKITVVDSL